MYPCFVCKLHSCINVRILEGEIRHDTAHHSVSLYSFSSRFSSVVVTITRNAAVWILHRYAIFSSLLRKYALAVIFTSLSTLYFLQKGAHFLLDAIAIECRNTKRDLL